MDLPTLVKKYQEIAGGFGQPVHLSQFGLPKNEIEKLVSGFDEDYQISRYLLLSREADEALTSYPPDCRVFLISGFECTHLSLHADIQTIL